MLTKFFGKTQEVEGKKSYLGKTAGVVWCYSNGRTACIVQIDRNDGNAHLTVFDSEDNEGKSVTNYFESIVTGVYLEHLAKTYRPDQLTFSQRTTLAGDPFAQFGVMPVEMEWAKDKGEFVNPRWGRWTPDNLLSEDESSFFSSLSLHARIGAETFMREKIVEKGLATPKKEEIYNEYKKRIAANGDKTRFNLRLSKIL
jgi:hypothetical protein